MFKKLSKFKQFSKKKALISSFTMLSSASIASAAVTVGQDGVMTGTLDMAPFFGAVTVVVAALAVIVAVKAGIRLLRSI
ncbi:TPA: hypothetical protein ACTOBS_001474 [Campylobacter jejuni]|nr:hypothetical protein [Campylobacter jejuni]HEF7719086.1 hypothetical protein [Campylobacter jejuni]